VFRGNGGASPAGTPTAAGWLFDFPLHSPASAETELFFAANFVHDFFYDLGFDEAAANFQADNFGRGGLAGDPLQVNARAPGRNNANYVHADEGSSPTINMFVWDGSGCWAADVDGDGSMDLDDRPTGSTRHCALLGEGGAPLRLPSHGRGRTCPMT